MKISIITEGSNQIGFGHISRCLAIYQAFEERNIIPTFYVNGDETISALLKDVHYELIDWIENHDLLFRKIKDSDAIIVDSYKASKDFYDRISNLTPIPIYFDDTLRLEYPAGYIINGAINAELLPYNKKAGQNFLLGTKYASLRKEFWEITDHFQRFEIQNMLITFGGLDNQNLTPRILRLLSRNFPEVKKRVIVTGAFTNLEDIRNSKDDNTEIIFSPSGFDLIKLMYEADLAISAAGQTLNELARVGVPTIAIAIADNQKNQIAGWVKEKFLLSDLWYMQPNLEHRLLLIINNMRKKQVRDVISKTAKLKIDGNGAKRIAQSIVEKHCGKTSFYYRKVISKDASLVFNLSNDRLVRANSINTEPIKWGDHLDWFSGKLLDDNCMFLLAFTVNDLFIGQVRFDIKGYFAEINISIDKDFRGKKYSALLILTSTYKIFHEKPNVGFVNAIIRPQNVPSIKAFVKAGYKYFDKEIINGQEFLIYQLKR